MRKNNKGVRGRRLKILPEKVESMLPTDDNTYIKRGKVVEAGPEAVARKGDTVIFTAMGMDKVEAGDETFYYVLDTDTFILEIL